MKYVSMVLALLSIVFIICGLRTIAFEVEEGGFLSDHFLQLTIYCAMGAALFHKKE